MDERERANDGLQVLDAAQARALGCLIEKETTTPDTYPLTVNAVQAAANQKTAREPVMALDQGAVHHALRALEQMGLARHAFSSRAERYEHRAAHALGLTAQQVALLGLLLLRGAQTVHELLARSERMATFTDADALRHALERLCDRQPALALRLPRASGQREDRYVHLMCGPVDAEAIAARHASPAAATPSADARLESRVAALEDEVRRLREAIAALH